MSYKKLFNLIAKVIDSQGQKCKRSTYQCYCNTNNRTICCALFYLLQNLVITNVDVMISLFITIGCLMTLFRALN